MFTKLDLKQWVSSALENHDCSCYGFSSHGEFENAVTDKMHGMVESPDEITEEIFSNVLENLAK